MTTIRYDKPVADFIAGLNKTGHVTHVKYKKTSVTFHHNGGRLSLQGILDVWKTRPASAHFQSDKAGNIGQYVDVNEYAWATGNTEGNKSSISIEMANETVAPTWRVSDVTWKSAARLAGWLFANVIDGRPRPSKTNVHFHKYWKSTDCAGPYMDTKYNALLAETQKWYDYFRNGSKPPATEGELSMSDVQKVLDYQAVCTQHLKDNFRQVLGAATKQILDYTEACASQIQENLKQVDATNDAALADQLAELRSGVDEKLDSLLTKAQLTVVPKPEDSNQSSDKPAGFITTPQ